MLQPPLELPLLLSHTRALGVVVIRPGMHVCTTPDVGGRVLLVDVVLGTDKHWPDAPEAKPANALLLIAEGEPRDSERLRHRVDDVELLAVGEAFLAAANKWLMFWCDEPLRDDGAVLESLRQSQWDVGGPSGLPRQYGDPWTPEITAAMPKDVLSSEIQRWDAKKTTASSSRILRAFIRYRRADPPVLHTLRQSLFRGISLCQPRWSSLPFIRAVCGLCRPVACHAGVCVAATLCYSCDARMRGGWGWPSMRD